MKRVLHFATKLNSRDIQKCNCFWVPSYDLFASAQKAVFPPANGDHPSQIERRVFVSGSINLPQKKFNSPFWTKVWTRQSKVLVALYKNPLHCFRRPFSVFLKFIPAVDFFTGTIVCSGQALTRLLCAFSDGSIPQEGDIVRIFAYTAINSSILLVTAMSVDRFTAVVFPLFYVRKVKQRSLVIISTGLVIFSAIFAALQLSSISVGVYRVIDQHLNTTFPLCVTTLCYLGIFFALRRKSSRVGFETRRTIPSSGTVQDTRQAKRAQMERKLASTSLLILFFLFLSLIPYFVAVIISANCQKCGEQKWFLVLIQSSALFLFLNSAANPVLTIFRIRELKKSVKIILHLRQEGNERSLYFEWLSTED